MVGAKPVNKKKVPAKTAPFILPKSIPNWTATGNLCGGKRTVRHRRLDTKAKPTRGQENENVWMMERASV